MRSEGGQDCLGAQDEAQANSMADSTNSMTSGPPDPADSFAVIDVVDSSSDDHEGVEAEPGNRMRGEFM